MTDHTLEISWWIKDPPPITKLPSSSLMSFTKYPVTDGQHMPEEDIIMQPQDPDYKRRSNGGIDGHVPRCCIIQIGSLKLYMNAKWLPLMMVIQLIQTSALRASISCRETGDNSKATTMLKLTWFYDSLLHNFALDAAGYPHKRSDGILIPANWMPDWMLISGWFTLLVGLWLARKMK